MRHAFQRFKKDHNKNYFNEYEEYHRFKIFKENFMKDYEMNQASEAMNGPSATFGVNKFSDMTYAEFERVYLGTEGPREVVVEKEAKLKLLQARNRAEIDWRAQGKVSPVKNQGQCGSNWAFSATGALEGIYMIQDDKQDISFSEQQLIDCSRAEGNYGCNGGFMDNSFKYLMHFAAESETSYPYAGTDQTCSDDPAKGVIKVSNYKDLEKTEEALYNALKQQPISVAIDIQSVYRYKDGIITKEQCNYQQLNHGSLLTGYKVDPDTKTPYWEVKNSWGTDWGVEGYMKIQAFTGGVGACGIALMNSYPSI